MSQLKLIRFISLINNHFFYNLHYWLSFQTFLQTIYSILNLNFTDDLIARFLDLWVLGFDDMFWSCRETSCRDTTEGWCWCWMFLAIAICACFCDRFFLGRGGIHWFGLALCSCSNYKDSQSQLYSNINDFWWKGIRNDWIR